MIFFIVFQLVAGGYLLLSAIRGKSKLFNNEYLRVPREKYVKTMRILCAVSGVALLFTNVLELSGLFTVDSFWGWLGWGIGLSTLVVMAVYSARCTDKNAAAARRRTTGVKDPLRAAFVFDDDEEEHDTKK